MANEIVKVHNDLTNVKLGKMNAKELDLFMSICHEMRDRGTDKVVLDFSKLRHLGHFSQTSNKVLVRELISANDKLLEFKVLIKNGPKTKQRTLFKEFETDEEALTLTCEMWEETAYILNNLVGNFTRIDLGEFVSLESKYAKRLYKLVKQYKTQGRFYMSKQDFYKALDVPETYKNPDFNKRCLKPALEECRKYIPSLECVPKKSGRGGAVRGYTFTFSVEIPPKPKKKTKNQFNEFEQLELDVDALESQILDN